MDNWKESIGKMKTVKTIGVFVSILSVLAVFILPVYAEYDLDGANCIGYSPYCHIQFSTGNPNGGTPNADINSSATFKLYNNPTSSTTYQDIAEKFIPAINTKLCYVRTKIDRLSADDGSSMVIRLWKQVAQPVYRQNLGGEYNAFTVKQSNAVSMATIQTSGANFVNFDFTAGGCAILEANQLYWFEYINQNGLNVLTPSFRAYQTAPTVFTNRGGFGQTSTISWSDTGRDWSFEILNDNTVASLSANPACNYIAGFGCQVINDFQPTSGSLGFEVSGANDFCENLLASTSDSFGIKRGLCFAGAVLFIPSQQSINQFSTLPQQLQTKLPFNYIYELAGDFSGASLSDGNHFASMSLSFPISSYGTVSLGFGMTQLRQYISDSNWTMLRTLMIVSIWIMWGIHVYHRVRRLIHK